MSSPRRIRWTILGIFVVVAGMGLWWMARQAAPSAPSVTAASSPSKVRVGPPEVGVAPPAELPPAPRPELKLDRMLGLRLPPDAGLGGRNMAEALAELGAVTDETARAARLQALLAFAAARDPATAAELALSLADAKLRDLGVGFVLLHWAEADPSAALRWAVEHPRGENDETRFFAAYEGFAGRRPLEALRWLARPEFAGDADELSRITIFHFNARGQLAEARTEIEKLPEGNLRELLVQQVVRVWAGDAPEAAAAWLAGIASDKTFRGGMGALVQALVETEPRFAAGLTQQIGDPAARSQHLADVIYVWARRDLGGAAAWLRQQPAGAQLDAAIAKLAEATAPFDPVEAKAWVNTISDAAKREEVRQRLGLGG